MVSLQGRGALQDIDQMSLFKPLCKFCASVRTVREIVPTVRKALAIAQSGTPGTAALKCTLTCKLVAFLSKSPLWQIRGLFNLGGWLYMNVSEVN